MECNYYNPSYHDYECHPKKQFHYNKCCQSCRCCKCHKCCKCCNCFKKKERFNTCEEFILNEYCNYPNQVYDNYYSSPYESYHYPQQECCCHDFEY